MSDNMKQTTTEHDQTNEGSGEKTGQTNENNNKEKSYNKQKQGNKNQRQYNEHQSTQYEGSNPEIGGVLALRNETFSKKVPFFSFSTKTQKPHFNRIRLR
jgi:hypothetical protein